MGSCSRRYFGRYVAKRRRLSPRSIVHSARSDTLSLGTPDYPHWTAHATCFRKEEGPLKPHRGAFEVSPNPSIQSIQVSCKPPFQSEGLRNANSLLGKVPSDWHKCWLETFDKLSSNMPSILWLRNCTLSWSDGLRSSSLSGKLQAQRASSFARCTKMDWVIGKLWNPLTLLTAIICT